jgi:hypothetical protein
VFPQAPLDTIRALMEDSRVSASKTFASLFFRIFPQRIRAE